MTSRASASAAMALDDLSKLFEGAKRSVFRLETLQVYEVGEDIERQRAFAAEGRLPPPSPDRMAFIRRMQERTERVANAGLAGLTEDFVLVDDEAGVWFRYDERGQLLGYERVAPEDLDRCREQRDLALAHAVRRRDYQPPST